MPFLLAQGWEAIQELKFASVSPRPLADCCFINEIRESARAQEMPAGGEEGRMRVSCSPGSQASQSLPSGSEDMCPVGSQAQGVGVPFAPSSVSPSDTHSPVFPPSRLFL